MERFKPTTLFSLEGYSHRSLFEELSYVWEALPLIKEYLTHFKGTKQPLSAFAGVTFEHAETIWVAEGVTIEPGALIRGPCILGEGTTVRHGAYLRGDLIVGKNCVIGHDVELKHSILLDGVHAAHFNYVGDSILGNDVNLGAGFICSNYRLDGNPIKVRAEGKVFKTGLTKFGAIMGDRASVGCNGVSNPGTILGAGVRSYPCMTFGGVFDANKVITNRETIYGNTGKR